MWGFVHSSALALLDTTSRICNSIVGILTMGSTAHVFSVRINQMFTLRRLLAVYISLRFCRLIKEYLLVPSARVLLHFC